MTFIKSLLKNETQIVLKKIGEPIPELLISDKDCMSIAFLDTETTGLDRVNDVIIELAIKVISFEIKTGIIVSIEKQYESFNDPQDTISKEITQLTGINNKMVDGSSIDWGHVDSILKNVELIVAHNASFDRAFVDRSSQVSPNLVWACTIQDIDWLSKGFSNSKQELLCYWHGFFFDAHRAMNDVDALINFLTHSSYKTNRPILELIENAKKPYYFIYAENFQYDVVKKDKVKANGFWWNADKKVWYKRIKFDEIESEKDWLTDTIYDSTFDGRIEEINLVDKYK